MCGIFCILSNPEASSVALFNEYKHFENLICRRGPNFAKSEFYKLTNRCILMAASVLWLQGNNLTEQPVKCEDSILIYNGDIFGGLENDVVRRTTGDTQLFLQALKNSTNISQTLHFIQGPYAFIYLNISENKIHFGRDIFGRRSLLVGKCEEQQQLVITSVGKRNTKFRFIELPSIGIFSINLCSMKWYLSPWRTKNGNFNLKVQEIESFLGINIEIGKVETELYKNFVSPDEKQFTFLNELLHNPPDEILDFLCDSYWSENISKLKKLLENSIKERISMQPKFCQNCFNQNDCNHASIGILFSGGVDCAILALLVSKFESSRPIDLINVAFEKGGKYETPDRLTGIDTWRELQDLSPETKWNFVEINVTRDELDLCRSDFIADLIYPLKSILDDSLGCALWFASRGSTAEYISPSRILLVGMGADELFGGYTRHRAAFKRRSWEGLHDVLNEDWQNLPHRNLARDDRVISDHGRQLRTPYLDEEVVQFVRNLDCWNKSIPSENLPQGVGEKILLRCLAHHLGLRNAAKFKKRALQFGCRIANPKENAHEVSLRL